MSEIADAGAWFGSLAERWSRTDSCLPCWAAWPMCVKRPDPYSRCRRPEPGDRAWHGLPAPRSSRRRLASAVLIVRRSKNWRAAMM
jgi:hypothetical protein